MVLVFAFLLSTLSFGLRLIKVLQGWLGLFEDLLALLGFIIKVIEPWECFTLFFLLLLGLGRFGVVSHQGELSIFELFVGLGNFGRLFGLCGKVIGLALLFVG